MKRLRIRWTPATVALSCFAAALAIDAVLTPADYPRHGSLVAFAMFAALFAPPIITIWAPRIWLIAWIPALLFWLHYVGIVAEHDDNIGSTASFGILLILNWLSLLGRGAVTAYEMMSSGINGYRG